MGKAEAKGNGQLTMDNGRWKPRLPQLPLSLTFNRLFCIIR